MERDLGVDTTPGQSRGVQGLFDGAVEIDLSNEEAGHILRPPLVSRVKSIAITSFWSALDTLDIYTRARDELDRDLEARKRARTSWLSRDGCSHKVQTRQTACQTVSKE